MDTKSIDYQDSELISQSDYLTFPELNTGNWLRQMGKFLVDAFSKSYEPKVEQTIDRDGNVSWRVHDPLERQTLWFHSEAEVRIWLDRRFG